MQIKAEGTGYIVANNTINYTSTNAGGWGGVTCFDYQLPLTSYSFIDNNHCNSAAPAYQWEATSGKSLVDWRTYSAGKLANGLSADESGKSFVGAPNFVNTSTSPYDFHPSTTSPISPLLGAGYSTYAPTSGVYITGTTNWLNPPAIGAYE